MVGPSATAIESAKNGMPRFAFTEPSIGSTTTRRGRPRRRALAQLLGDEHEVLAERLEPRDDRRLGCRVDRRRVVAAFAGAQDRLALLRRRQVGENIADVRDAARQSSSQAVMAPAGGRAGPRGASGRSRSSSAASPRRAGRARRHRRSGSVGEGTRCRPRPRRRAATASCQSGVYEMPSWPKRSTSSTSSSPGSPRTSCVVPPAYASATARSYGSPARRARARARRRPAPHRSAAMSGRPRTRGASERSPDPGSEVLTSTTIEPRALRRPASAA